MDVSEEDAFLPQPSAPPPFPTLEARLVALGLRFSSSLGELKRSRRRIRRFGFSQLHRQNTLIFPELPSQPAKVKPTDTQGVVLSWISWESARWVTVFRCVMACALFYSVLTSLFFLGFVRPTDDILQADRALQVLFGVEICTGFFIVRTDKEGFILISRRLVAWAYLKSWLVADVLAVVPFRELGFEDVTYLARFPRLLKLIFVVRNIRTNLVDGAITAFKHSRLAPKILQISYYVRMLAGLGETLFHLSLLTYTLSCVFLWFSELTSGWEAVTFAKKYGLAGDLPYMRVLKTMYFFLSTLSTVGYGDFVPRNAWEQSFMIVVLFIGVVLFSIFIGQLNAGIVEYQASTDNQEQTDVLLTWLSNLEHRFGRLPNALKTRILSHYNFYHRYDRLKSLAKSYWRYRSYSEMAKPDGLYVEHLPEETFHAVCDDLFSDVFYKFRTFFGSSSSVKYALAPHFQPRAYQIGEEIIAEDTQVQELVFVLHGAVLCGVKVYTRLHSIIVFEQGWTLLGDFEVLTGEKSIGTYQCAGTKSMVAFAIPRKALNFVLDEGFTDVKISMTQRALTRRKDLKRLIGEFTASLSHQMTSLQGFITGLLIRALTDVKGYSTFVHNLQKRFISKQRLEALPLNSQSDVETTEGELYCEVEDELTENKAVLFHVV